MRFPSIRFRHSCTPFAALAGLLICGGTALAQTGDAGGSASQRRDYVDRLTTGLKVSTAGRPSAALERSEKPILQWSWERNGFTDGQTFLWGSGGRPLAFGGAFLIPGERTAHYELVSISPQPLICRRDGEPVWTPPAVDLAWFTFSKAPPPAASSSARLGQMRALARQIDAVAIMGPPRYAEGTRWELRLLTTPIDRYADADHGILDGSVFALVMGTDPQLLLLLEAQQENGEASWKAAFAPLSGFELAASLGEEQIWSAPKAENGHAKDSVWHLSPALDASDLFGQKTE